MTRFFLIRHATNDTVGKLIAGRSAGIHLNEEGNIQAQKLAARLASVPLKAIYTSPLERAIETAQPLAELQNLSPMICDDLTEINFGEWTGKKLEELENDPAFQLFNSFRSCSPIPGGESMPEVQLRMIKGLQKLTNNHPNGVVAVVSHGDLIKAAIAYYSGIPLDLFQRIEISPASVSIIDVYDDSVKIMGVNYTGEI